MSRGSNAVLPGVQGRSGAGSPRRRFLAAIMALLWCSALLVSGVPGAGAAVEPRLTRSPAAGPATTEITISGGRFFPLEAIDVYFDRKDLTLAVADASGAFWDGPRPSSRGPDRTSV